MAVKVTYVNYDNRLILDTLEDPEVLPSMNTDVIITSGDEEYKFRIVELSIKHPLPDDPTKTTEIVCMVRPI